MVTFSDTLRHPSCTTAPSSLANCKLITDSSIGNIINDCHHLTFPEWCSLPPSHCFSPLRPHFMCSHRWKSVLCVAWWWTMPSAHTCKKFRFLRMLDSSRNDQSSWYRNATISINLCSYLRRKSMIRIVILHEIRYSSNIWLHTFDLSMNASVTICMLINY